MLWWPAAVVTASGVAVWARRAGRTRGVARGWVALSGPIRPAHRLGHAHAQVGAVTEPALVELAGVELSPDQVRRPPRLTRSGGALPAPLGPSYQPPLGHDRSDGVLADPPAQGAQIGGDPRRPVGAPVLEEQRRDQLAQPPPAGPANAGIPTAPCVEPGWGDPQRTAADRDRDLVLRPLGVDELGHRYLPIASLTQRATERLSTLCLL